MMSTLRPSCLIEGRREPFYYLQSVSSWENMVMPETQKLKYLIAYLFAVAIFCYTMPSAIQTLEPLYFFTLFAVAIPVGGLLILMDL